MKKTARLLRMFEAIKSKDETLVKGKWKRVSEEDVDEVITIDQIGKYRRFEDETLDQDW